MKTTFKPELRKKNRNDREGYINVRMTRERRNRYFSIGVKIPVDLWNEKQHSI